VVKLGLFMYCMDAKLAKRANALFSRKSGGGATVGNFISTSTSHRLETIEGNIPFDRGELRKRCCSAL
jgi:hypothetical protein